MITIEICPSALLRLKDVSNSLKRLFLVSRTISISIKDATNAIVHVHIANKLMEAYKWLIYVKTVKKENFPLRKFAKTVKSRIVCLAKKRGNAKNVSSIIISQLLKPQQKGV